MATKFAVETIFKAVDRVSGPLTRMTSGVNRFANTAERSLGRVNKTLNSTSDAISGGIKATTAAAAASGAALAKVTQTGAEFEQQITNAAAKFPGEIRRGTAAFEQLETAARRVGSATEFSASMAGEALNFLAMAGFDAQQAVGALPGVVDLATAAGVGLAEATDVASDSLGAFGLMTKDAVQLTTNLTRINDVLAKTTTTANTTVAAMFETIKEGAPVAKTAGVSLETFAALTGELANSGIKASTAGTTLKNVFLKLAAPAGESAKILDRLGVVTKDSGGNVRDIIAIFDDLGATLDGMGTAQRSGILEGIFGKIPIAGVNVLLSSGTEKLNAYREQLEAASGSAARMASVMRDTTRADINGMTSALEGLTITLFDFNREGIREGLGGLTSWIRTIDQTLQSNEALGKSIGQDVFNAVISLGKAILVLIGAVVALKVASIATSTAIIAFKVASAAATAATWAWNAATAAMPAVLATARAAVLAFNIALWANPIGVVVAAVVALVGVAALLIANWDKVTAFFVSLWEGIKGAFVSAIDGIMAVVNPFINVVNSVRSIWDKLRGTVSEPIEAEINTKQNVITTAGDGVISPQEGIVRSMNENKSSAEVTLRNETNSTAEVTQRSGGMNLNIMSSGAF